jgi:dihydrodipicolinate reductase
MIIQESEDKSVSLATTLSQALSKDKRETLLALIDPKMPKTRQDSFIRAMESGATIAFQLMENSGKRKIARYEVVIDFTSNEVHVIMLDNKHEYNVNKYKVVKK